MNRGSSSKGMPSNGRMGSCSSGRKGVVVIDSDGNESFRSTRRKLGDYLIQLSDKGKSRREEALPAIAQALTMELKVEFVEKNFATLLYQCLCFIRKGSTIEIDLASKTIGLLGMILEDEYHAHEVYQDSIPVLSQVLQSGSKKLKILHSLAIVSFFGANNTDEIQTAMQIIWKFLKPDCGNKKHSTKVLAAAISAWSFLLSTVEGWRLDHKYWQGSVSYLLNLLEEEGDESVYLAAAEALALVFETDCFEKFSTEAKESRNAKKQEMKVNITDKLRCLAVKASKEGAKQEAKIVDFLKFFESGKSLESSAKIGKDKLKFSTWSQRIQLNFVKNFLGEDGFVKHMRMNKNLHAVFEFKPRGKNSTSNELCTPEREEITVSFFQPSVHQEDCSLLPFTSKEKKQLAKKMTMSPSSNLNKARTRLLNKKRMISQENDISHYMVDEETQ